jgi:hypothetical protein
MPIASTPARDPTQSENKSKNFAVTIVKIVPLFYHHPSIVIVLVTTSP